MAEPTGLELISEGGNLGWRLLGRDSSLYGSIGQKAVDFSSSNISNTIDNKGATGAYSLSFGMNTSSSGEYSIAGGNSATASGASSVAFGKDTKASGNYSFVVGISNSAVSLNSFVIGSQNYSEGTNSFVGGTDSKVLTTDTFKTGSNSIAFGDGIVIDNPNSSSFGRYNLNDGNDNSGLYKSFTVGIGISDTDRRNAFEVYDGGGIEYGSIKAPYLQQSTIDADQTGKVLITKEYFEGAYNHAFDDAPIDGFVYGRKNKEWTKVAELDSVQVFFKGTLPPPSDFAIPGRDNEYFEPGDVYLHYNIPYFITDGNINIVDGDEAIYDGNYSTGGGEKVWILRDGSIENPVRDNYWTEFNISGGIEDVEVDDVKYVRKNKEWVPLGIQQIVWKGVDKPTILSDFGSEGDKYLKEASFTTGFDYVINMSVSESGYIYWPPNTGTLISGTPDVTNILINGGEESSVELEIIGDIVSTGSIIINGFIFLLSDSIELYGGYSWTNNTAADLFSNIQENGTQVTFYSTLTSLTSDYQEYTKLSDGTWRSLNIERLEKTPLDKILENADIVSATYDDSNNILSATYGSYADISPGYSSAYVYNDDNKPTSIIYSDNENNIKLTINIAYDSNGNMTSFIRS